VVRKFKTEEEVLKMSNETEFSQDINKALRVAEEFESGMVGVNCISAMFLGQPFGGYKQSGVGREGGKEGMLAWMDYKTIFVNCTY
jgi:acyl-CoA reductase-like NAD-dependent aldehyde dehydrogenase